mgnify:CR=1 FL=1
MDNPVQEAAAKSAVQLMLQFAKLFEQNNCRLSVHDLSYVLKLAFIQGATYGANAARVSIERELLEIAPTLAVAS